MTEKNADLPDPRKVAQQEAEQIKNDYEFIFEKSLKRAIADRPSLDRERLFRELVEFHRERMNKIPPRAKYPEAAPWVGYVIERDRELQRISGLSDREMAQLRSLNDYLRFRGWGNLCPVSSEKCRVVYLPDSDRGEFHIKNVDDPLTNWEPSDEPPPSPRFPELMMDGVGAGLHLDDEPEQIFPLPIRQMCSKLAENLPSALEFLQRYSPFWGAQNLLLHDRQKCSIAIEKTSYNFMDVYEPGTSGESHISGMVCREPKTEQGRYVERKRKEFTERIGQDEEGPCGKFWQACDRAEQMLAELLSKVDVTIDEILELFTTTWPEGLNKAGAVFHPDQPYASWTLVTHARLPDQGMVLRWQRSADGAYPDKPQVFEYPMG
ncbi:MAG: hypothetical protein ACLFWL_04400 [Candidatus Brocadiia bacterium]